MEEAKTTVNLSLAELQTLLELASLASGRMSIAEKLYFDALLSRFTQELTAQTQMPPDLMPSTEN